MASCKEWSLQGFPLPSTLSNGGQYELAAQKGLVYRVFDDNYVVELNTANSSARLWEIQQTAWDIGSPPGAAYTVGIAIAKNGHVWLAPKVGMGLQELDPATGNLTHYVWNISAATPSMVVSLDNPCRLRFDASGALWFGFTGGEPNIPGVRPIIGRRLPGAASVDFWQIPVPLGGAVDFWPEAKSGIVWFSFMFGMTPKDPPLLGRLDTVKNEVDWWRLSRPSSNRQCVAALAGDRLSAARALGIAYSDATVPGLVLRYDIAADQFFHFSEKGMNPADLDFDSQGNLWAADVDGRMYRNGPKAKCREMRLSRCTAEVRRMTLPLVSSSATPKPQPLVATLATDSVSTREEKCYEVFQLPKHIGTAVGGITCGTPRGKKIFYSLPMSFGIGVLVP